VGSPVVGDRSYRPKKEKKRWFSQKTREKSLILVKEIVEPACELLQSLCKGIYERGGRRKKGEEKPLFFCYGRSRIREKTKKASGVQNTH